MAIKKKTVAIFSREHQSCYEWLINFFLTTGIVKDVRPVHISNDYQKFREEASKCNFAILYHSKNRGRINVTDVTDSLYDDELQHLNNQHGKKNVIVVIDDLEDSDNEKKIAILNTQPSIRELAQDLFLFSTSEKAFLHDHQKDRYQTQTDLTQKMDDLKKTIEGKKVKSRGNHGVVDVDRSEEPGEPLSTRDYGVERSGGPQQPQSRRCKICVIVSGAACVIIFIIVLVTQLNHHTPPVNGTTTPGYTSTHDNTPLIIQKVLASSSSSSSTFIYIAQEYTVATGYLFILLRIHL
ncbi:uncharacterized protein LOC142098579 [Mixophyes fleayi]|uniref:uncharacterized protein LOC142098579 n=1 Tax=Mixophyes fleayi TaxID=3061075 RepID=UPI003F4E26FA